MIVVGLSSGTSVDGIDAAAADLRLNGGTAQLRPLGYRGTDYDAGLRSAIVDALPPAATRLQQVCTLHADVGRAFAAAAEEAVAQLCAGTADLIVSHGQTLYHAVDDDGRVTGTLQVGEPAWVAERTGLPVVSDLRARDIAAGGQGAPLASTFDTLLLGGRETPAAAVNLGGIANVTVVDPHTPPLAYDTGPGNALIDAATELASRGEEPYDIDGRRAAAGRVDGQLLAELLDEPYYRRAAPKSTGKELFNHTYLRERAGTVVDDDLVATATALTARTVADACRAHAVEAVFVSGGGTHNATLMQMLAGELDGVAVTTTDALGIPVDAKEAYLFALLGFMTWHGVPSTVPSCTGAARPTVVGRITPGRRALSLPAPARTPICLRVL